MMPATHTNLLYHLIFSTKCRRPIITPHLREELYRYIGGIVRGEGGVLLEIGGINDHVHILAKFKPSRSVSAMLGDIKANSSKWVNETKLKIRKFGWQDGYGTFSVSESQVPTVTKYIQTQEKHHRIQTFQAEYIALLKIHHIEYDDRYLWD